MFFILSKILVFLIRPITWITGLLLYSYFGRNKKWKKRCLGYSILILFVFSNSFLLNQAIKIWEVETIRASDIQTPYDIGILLGGYSNTKIIPSHDRHNFSERANRFNNTLELYRSGKIKKILLTGGSGSILQKQAKEASEMQSFLRNLGIPNEDIIVEAESRNTRENAMYTKAIIQEKFSQAKCLLITSAWHMRRSKGCFDKVDLLVTPYSVDHLSEVNNYSPEALFLPNSLALRRWDWLLKEWVGYVVYWLKGYI